MKILLATSNPHKLEEIRAIFAQCDTNSGQSDAAPIDLVSLDVLEQDIEEPVEDGKTFEANALIKAEPYATATGIITLADDSGLEVDALGGAPGVHSARYAGAQGPRRQVDLANNRLLLKHLARIPTEHRTARFVCAMALIGKSIRIQVRGVVKGRILRPEEAADPNAPHLGRGQNGFGYDPLFHVEQFGKTTAQLTCAQKNRISHRGQAARRMWAKIKTFCHQ